jgi:hypothetical protein
MTYVYSSISLSCDRSIVTSKLSFSVFGERLSRNSYNVVVFLFAFHIAVQQPLKPQWSRLLLCDHEPSQRSNVLCFMSLLMSLLPASGEILSEFPSPRVILSFFPHPWPYHLGWPCEELKLLPASLSGSWGVLGPLTTSRWQTFERDMSITLYFKISANDWDRTWGLSHQSLARRLLDNHLKEEIESTPKTSNRATVVQIMGNIKRNGDVMNHKPTEPDCVYVIIGAYVMILAVKDFLCEWCYGLGSLINISLLKATLNYDVIYLTALLLLRHFYSWNAKCVW